MTTSLSPSPADSRIQTLIVTCLFAGSASLLAQSAQSLQQPGVLGLQLFDQTLSGALIHHCPVLDTLGPEEEGEGEDRWKGVQEKRRNDQQEWGEMQEMWIIVSVIYCTSQRSAGWRETPHSRYQQDSEWQSVSEMKNNLI